jgi:hypothetical protein
MSETEEYKRKTEDTPSKKDDEYLKWIGIFRCNKANLAATMSLLFCFLIAKKIKYKIQ